MHWTAERLAEMESSYVAEFILACVRHNVSPPSTEQAAAYFKRALALDWSVRHWIVQCRTGALT